MASEIRVNQIQNRSGLSTVTFSDSGVILSGVTTITGNLEVSEGITASITGDINAGIITSTQLNVGVGGTVIATTAGGNVGINSISPERRLDVVDSGASGSVIRSRVTTNNGGYLAYEALNSSGTSVFSVTHNGRINLSENIVFASGQGLDFSATTDGSGTMTSELLSDYEEGTWDCRPTTSTSSIVLPSGITGVNYNGTYVKIGSMVYLTGYFETSQTSADTSAVHLRLPFAVNATSNMWSSCGTETNRWSFPSGVTYITVRPESGQSYATFKGCGSGTQRVDMTANTIFANSNGYWVGMMMYRTS